MALLGTFAFACKSIEVESIRTRAWPTTPYEDIKDVGIGYFDSSGSGMSPLTRTNFYRALAFALREAGYTTAESAEIGDLLEKSSLPADRTLTENEVELFNRSFGGKLYLQGGVQEVRTETLLEDLLQVMVHVSIHEMRTGQKLGEIKVFGRDLEYNTGRETLKISRLVAEELDDMVLDRNGGALPEAGR
jgi:hypothetical protein